MHRFNPGTARRRCEFLSSANESRSRMPKLFHKTLNLNPVTSLRRATRRPEDSPYFSDNFGRGRDKSRQRSRQLPSSRNWITDITEGATAGATCRQRHKLRDSNKPRIVPRGSTDTQYPRRERHTWGRCCTNVALARKPVLSMCYSNTNAECFGVPMGSNAQGMF